MLTADSPHRVRPEVTRYVSTFVLCGVMTLFAGLLSVAAHEAQGPVLCASANQTSIHRDWPAARISHRVSAPHDDAVDQDVDDPDARVHQLTLAPLGADSPATRRQAFHTRIALPAAHADGPWLRAP